MFTANTYEAALKAGAEVEVLEVNKKWIEAWQTLMPSLTGLKKLILRSGSDLDPRSVTQWPENLTALEIVVTEPAVELEPWIEALPNLLDLEVWGTHLKSGNLPDKIGDWSLLRSLELVSCGLVDLPSSLAGCHRLERLDIRGLPMTTFPKVICELSSLKELSFRQPVFTLPDEMAKLIHLETLNLSSALNDGTMSADEKPASMFRPMPKVIAKLPALKSLKLNMCGIFERDLEALAGHENLQHLFLWYGGVAELTSLRDLPALRELRVQSCYRLRDISPLAGLPIEVLDISHTYIKDLSPLLEMPALRSLVMDGCDGCSVAPILCHPTLTDLQGNDDLVLQWSRRQQLAGVTPESIREDLACDAPDRVEKALKDTAVWIELTSSRGSNGCTALFDVQPSDELTEIPLLTRALNLPEISTAAIAAIAGATFRDMYDKFAPTLYAIEIFLSRGTLEDQLSFVEAFQRAGKYYDAGHREFGYTVQDQLIEDYFPRFSPAALAKLLAKCSGDALNSESGDAMDALFIPAYTNASADVIERLDKCLQEYIDEYREHLGDSYFQNLLSLIEKVNEGLRKRLNLDVPEASASKEEEKVWEQRLHGVGTREQAVEVLEALLHAHQDEQLASQKLSQLSGYVRHALKYAKDLPEKLAESWVVLALELDEILWINTNLLMPVIRSEGRFLESVKGEQSALLEKAISFAQRREPEYDIASLAQARATLAGVPVEEMRQKMVIEDLLWAIKEPRCDIPLALKRFRENPSTLEIGRSLTSKLAIKLDSLHTMGKMDELEAVMTGFWEARMHFIWEPSNIQYCLTYLLPSAVEHGPGFFARMVQPWLDGEEVTEPRFAFNLACYQAHHGGTEALCEAVALALKLGRPKEQFLADGDFAHRIDEPALQALLREDS